MRILITESQYNKILMEMNYSNKIKIMPHHKMDEKYFKKLLKLVYDGNSIKNAFIKCFPDNKYRIVTSDIRFSTGVMLDFPVQNYLSYDQYALLVQAKNEVKEK